MLEELSQYENLGTPKFFCELFTQLKNTKQPWKTDNVRGYFYNRIIDEQTIFDGCLPMAQAVGAVIIDDEGLIALNSALEASLVSEKYLAGKLLEMILSTFRKDKTFHEIFCSGNVSNDPVYKLIQIESHAFRFRYSCFKKLLIDFELLYPHPDVNIRKLIVNPKYKKLFDSQVMPEIKKRKIGIGELEKSLEQKQIYGAEAEAHVLAYEQKRLASHSNFDQIERISEYDVGAGYDIVSFNELESTELDRLIEVKSFSDTPSFHWSRNEIDVARFKKDQYFIYLVDRDKMNEIGYTPTIIQNPYDTVLADDTGWNKRVDSYFIVKTGDGEDKH